MKKYSKQAVDWNLLYKDYLLLLLSNRLSFSRKVYYFIQAIQVVQLFTLIVQPENALDLPWDYTHFSMVWILISISVRINYLFTYLGVSYINDMSIIFLLSTLYLSKLMIFYKIYILRKYDLAASNITHKLKWLYITNIERYTRYLLFEVGLIPSLLSILNLNLTFSSANSPSSAASISILLIAYMTLCIEDSLYLQSISWKLYQTPDFISDPRYIFMKRMIYLIVVVLTRYVNFSEKWFVHIPVLIGTGGYLYYKFGMHQSYGDMYMNCIEVCKGVVIGWGGIVMTLCVWNGYNEKDITGTLLYVLVLPFIMYLSIHIIRIRYQTLINSYEKICETQLFHILLRHTTFSLQQNTDSGQVLSIPDSLQDRIKDLTQHSQYSAFTTLWMLYFFLSMEYNISVKILISILEYHISSKLIFPYICLLKNDLRESVANDPDENEASSYISFTQKFTELLKLDELSCWTSQKFYRELLSDVPNSNILSKLLLSMTEEIITTENYYEYVLNTFSKHPVALHYYSGFLNSIKSSPKYKEIGFLAAKLYTELKGKSKFDKELKFFDDDSCNMVVNLEVKKRGEIIWICNSNIYGYEDLQLLGTEFREMIPEPVKKMHDLFFARLFDVWSSHFALHKTVDVFLLDSEKFLVAAIYKARMTNLENGKLVVLTGLKPDYDGLEIAFLDNEGKYLLNLVINIQTRNMNSFLSWSLKIHPNKVKGTDIFDIIGMSEWKSDVVVARNYENRLGCVVEVRTYDFHIGRYVQKSLVMYKGKK